MKIRIKAIGLVVAAATVLSACGGGGSATPPSAPTSTTLTVTGTGATGLAIPGATVTGKCKVGTGTATTLADGSYTLTVTDGQLPCMLQITNPVDGIKLHTVVFGTGSTANANITPLTEMATARVLGSEPNVFFAAFDAAVAIQKITSPRVLAAQTDIALVLTGTVETAALGDFISAPLKAATQSSPTTGDAQDKLLDTLKLKLTTAQLGTVTTALASTQTADAIKQTVISLTTAPTTPPVANAGTAQSVIAGSTVTLDASTSSAATGKSLTYAWTLTSKPVGSTATLAASTTAKPTFVADLAGAYVASVIVNDGTTASSASAVTVTASASNAAPVANAGVTQNVVAGSVVTLDGSASSDANGDSLTYAWTLTSKPAGSTAALSSVTSAKPTFTADVAGSYVGTLTVNDGKVNSAALTVNITAATPPSTSVSGLISTSTHWTLANSPYILSSNVLIPVGVTLDIDPGVRVIGGSGDIQVAGTFSVNGIPTQPVKLENLRLLVASANPAPTALISIVGAVISGGSLFSTPGAWGPATFVLTDSRISGVTSLYLWYPVGANRIERNVFVSEGGISFGLDSNTTLSIVNNKFTGTGFAVQNWANYSSAKSTVRGNSFLRGANSVYLPDGYSSSKLDAIGNFWGTTDASIIATMIYDKNDSLLSHDIIPFTPFLMEPDPATPN